ncbi:NADH dehydrogenase (quinone) subunit D [Geobacter sulfurreducens]|uniref:NADH-quinone oxidoreductase subunit D n=1 Tax=Geobacter sulfurreducens (strain ATCC 51573 / DSM 12127 / PCA) TaxID=243231 RepID=NUOD_GEOSL|nr:NADH dehydrogenase (quinone) subunit D [Geobacter sulfurreducens]Q74GA5.1 RecName: Full=NADH-quinone oxidoreductase subunit D; AltName: Full=NADH dehydrogenase I subunit D; AltName: Full=NDH-1 subunit D [Geobacter sulfurreducens PCA]AAR33674.1 NADH dehydrogenase I, D subunit [Geobacter sulfurreducens PCA]ADI83172.2 NADH dehydrogenase I, D subunit [Geobacter sulfurreducens KN400]AJY70066.1 NADH dehydrogenase [Geobacter sulfurreducens]QVW35601.1 NADH dehydrogenase (quinone) subunit D [Geobact
MASTEIMTVNMGPQHPSTHGVLRMVIELDGEVIQKITPHIGYLHRGVEKLSEHRTYHQTIPLTDRLDYLAPMSNNLGYVLAVEKLLGIEIPERAQTIRVIMAELTRLKSHLVWIACHALDIGAMTVFIYAFREREMIMSLYEKISGARMTSNYFRVGGLSSDVYDGFEKDVREVIDTFPGHFDTYEGLLTKNTIWVNRTVGNGVISAEDAVDYGITGPALRGSGVDWDLRRDNPYSGYEKYSFKVPVGEKCDTFDRYKVRLIEMREAVNIIRQALDSLKPGPVLADNPQVTYPPKENVYNSIEGLIHHFKIASEGFPVPEGEVYQSVEAPKGELGYYIVSDGGPKPYRMRIRPPSFVNLGAIEKMAKGSMIADLVAVIGTLDIVLGEIDR